MDLNRLILPDWDASTWFPHTTPRQPPASGRAPASHNPIRQCCTTGKGCEIRAEVTRQIPVLLARAAPNMTGDQAIFGLPKWMRRREWFGIHHIEVSRAHL